MFGRRQTILAAALALAPALAGCGDDDAASGPASVVPPDAPFYADAAIRPGGDRAEAIAAITDTVAGISDPGALIVDRLDEELEAEATYAEDIEPWLGEEAAVFVHSLKPSALAAGMPDGAIVVETTDVDAAKAFVDATIQNSGLEVEPDERSYEGGDYLSAYEGEIAVGFVDEFLIYGTESSFKAAVDASMDESLADSDDFTDQVGALDDDNLAEMWLDLGTALDAAAESSGADGAEIDAARAALGPLLGEPIAVSLAATAETVTLDTSAAGGTGIGGDTELLGELPADAWLAVAVAGAGDALSETLSGIGALGAQLGSPELDPDALSAEFERQTGLDLEDDLLSWIGDVSAYVAGTSGADFRAGGILETSDPEASAAAIESARQLFEQSAGRPAGPPRLDDADEGFAALGPTGQGLELVLRDDQVVVALGGANPAADLLEPAQTLSGSERFDAAADALGGDYAATAYLALQDFLVVAEEGGQASDPDYLAARPYLDALDFLVFGTSSDGDRDLSRVVLGVGE